LTEKPKIFGTLSQRELLKLYATYVSAPKADFFQNLSLGVVQGPREGIYVKTLEGLRRNQPPLEWIDCRTSGGVFNLGHRHPAMIQALKEGLDGGLDIGDHHLISEQRALLAKQLAELLPPGISKTQFCVGGGEAVDLAIKLARAATKRTKIISAKGGYHGVTGFGLAAGDPRFKAKFGWELPDFVQVEFGDINAFRAVIDDHTAGVIFETIPATAGILIAPPNYFSEVRSLCDKHGVIMISDEVQTGLGRTGEFWGIYGGMYPSERVIPDIIVLAKGMSAGIYPLATCSYKPALESIFSEDPFLHISTTGGSELGCYVTRKMLDLVTVPEFLNHVKQVGKLFGDGLAQLQKKYPTIIKIVRGRGLMWGIELPNSRYGIGLTLKMIQNGIWADYCGNNEKVIKLMPPLIIKSTEMEEVIRRLDKAFADTPPPPSS
jgi:putrescine aminotransferase